MNNPRTNKYSTSNSHNPPQANSQPCIHFNPKKMQDSSKTGGGREVQLPTRRDNTGGNVQGRADFANRRSVKVGVGVYTSVGFCY